MGDRTGETQNGAAYTLRTPPQAAFSAVDLQEAYSLYHEVAVACGWMTSSANARCRNVGSCAGRRQKAREVEKFYALSATHTRVAPAPLIGGDPRSVFGKL